jgi:hypothetical protein
MWKLPNVAKVSITGKIMTPLLLFAVYPTVINAKLSRYLHMLQQFADITLYF